MKRETNIGSAQHPAWDVLADQVGAKDLPEKKVDSNLNFFQFDFFLISEQLPRRLVAGGSRVPCAAAQPAITA
jgi:hypothetical protein